MKRAIILAMCCGVGQAADAGAWLREKQTGFASLSFGVTETEDATGTFFLEYGLSEKTTIGVDISAFRANSSAVNGFGNLFVRRSIGPTDRTSKWAYEVGIGGYFDEDKTLPAVKTTVSWGRGFQMRDRPGWVNIDATYILEPELKSDETKLDATAGYAFGGITTGILEVTYSNRNNNSFGAVEPSLLFSPKQTAFQIKLGAQFPIDEDDSKSLKLGIWRSF